MNNYDLFGNQVIKKHSLADKFIIPPFSIFNSDSNEWQKKKKIWNNIINDKAQARANKLRCYGNEKALSFMSIRNDTSNTSVLDPVMSEIILEWFTLPNYKVYDPFAGDAIFGTVSSYKNRLFTGIELREEQCIFNNNIVSAITDKSIYICDDANNIDNHISDNSQDFLFSCPPYADLEVYSDNPFDLSNMSYEKFFTTIEIVLKKCFNKLKENRFACIVIGEVRDEKTGFYIGLVPKIINIMQSVGFGYYNEIILKTPIGNLHMRAGRYMNHNRKVGKQHQNILIFYKGNTHNIKKHFPKLYNESKDI